MCHKTKPNQISKTRNSELDAFLVCCVFKRGIIRQGGTRVEWNSFMAREIL